MARIGSSDPGGPRRRKGDDRPPPRLESTGDVHGRAGPHLGRRSVRTSEPRTAGREAGRRSRVPNLGDETHRILLELWTMQDLEQRAGSGR